MSARELLRVGYEKLVLDHPVAVLAMTVLIVAFFGYHATAFRLDASADSLVLENDKALERYRSVRARYGADDFLIIAYTPTEELFSQASLTELRHLRDALRQIAGVQAVTSVLDVPLISSIETKRLNADEFSTLDNGADPTTARTELITSPLYRDLLISADGRTTAMQINLGVLADDGVQTVAPNREQQDIIIRDIRRVMDQHRKHATAYLGGVPMIVADSIAFIAHDLSVFGATVLAFVLTLLAISFRRVRWVLLPLVVCGCTIITTVGMLGLLDWPVTVVSSNFVSLLLIITLSLVIHLVVRFRELHRSRPHESARGLVTDTVRSKFLPCLYTALTTIIAFGSLLVSEIRPVIDFGWMMCIGITIGLAFAFTVFPAALMLLTPGTPPVGANFTTRLTGALARLIESRGAWVLFVFVIGVAIQIYALQFLDVKNRFIDYYKQTTEIYQGMAVIDQRLGGTTPFEVIIDAPDDFEPFDAEALAEFYDEPMSAEDVEIDLSAGSYWYNAFMLDQVGTIHNYLDSLTDTGKVLSLHTSVRTLAEASGSDTLDDFQLSLLQKKLPDSIKQILFDPYLSADGNQLRFAMRVYESDTTLNRQALIDEVQTHLTQSLQIDAGRIHLTGMMVLYNNVLQSLFRSQILTLGAVFLCVLVMFAVVFRNAVMALAAIVPNVVAAVVVLGVMGWLRIPLDIMTITIAAICVGIAVDDTIHYVHRFCDEFRVDGDYWGAIKRAHASIGLAMFYTSTIITLGFSILALSNFVPTIHFGLLTGFSMVVALLADLTLLPLLIAWLKPMKGRAAVEGEYK